MIGKFLSEVKAELTPAKIVAAIVIVIIVSMAIKFLAKKVPMFAGLSAEKAA